MTLNHIDENRQYVGGKLQLKQDSDESVRCGVPHSPSRVTLRTRLAAMLCLMLLCSGASVNAQHPGPTAREVPKLTRISPEAAAPHTQIKLEGSSLGANLDEGVQVIFVQGSVEYKASAHGRGYEGADVEHGLQNLGVVVPDDLQPGSCGVIVEVNGQRSASLALKINVAATPPVLSSLRPLLPQPGDMLWIYGTGVSESDVFELTDALGKMHHVRNGGGTYGAAVAAFTLPSDLPGGETKLRAIEHRSGSNQVSNTLTFSVVRGPAPLDVLGDELIPVAPGQWLDFVVTSETPIKDAERVEVAFRQKNQLLILPLEDPKKLRVQVPSTLLPGSVEIQTRTWVAGESSPWSSPVDFRLLDKPAASKVYSLAIRPVRAEAAFKQDDRIVAISSVADADYPRVRVPTEKLSPGMVYVLTRVWRGGEASAWLFKHYGFDWPARFLPDGTMGDVPFMDGITLGPDTPKELVVYPGEGLILGGTFPVSSAEKLQVTLECAGHLSIVLSPLALATPQFARINLPDDLEAGDWELTVSNDNAAVKLKTKLRIKAPAGY